MNKNPDTIEYGNYVVAFVDVLGQKEHFSKLDKYEIITDTQDSGLKESIIELHKQTAMFVSDLRGFYDGFFESSTGEREVPAGVPPDKVHLFKQARKCNLKSKSFSDCLQMYTPLKTESWHCHAANAVYAMIFACGSSMLWSLAKNKVIRAGIDVGIGIEIGENEVYGPAWFKAHHLESKVADYPRIVISDRTYNYLGNLAIGHRQSSDQTQEDIGICKSMAVKTMSFIRKDYDGVFVVDYLSDEFTSGARSAVGDEGFNLLIQDATKYVNAECERFAKENNKKLLRRFKILQKYICDRKLSSEAPRGWIYRILKKLRGAQSN